MKTVSNIDGPTMTINLLPINQEPRRSDRLAQGDMVVYQARVGIVVGGSFENVSDMCAINVQYITPDKESIIEHNVKRSALWSVLTIEVDHP